MKKKPIDPIDIKQAIKNGQLIIYENNGRIYAKDAPDGDCVCILTLGDGCEGCKFVKVQEWDMPCADCKNSHKNYWRMK